MELTIDNRCCDTEPGTCAVPGYDAVQLADIGACREGRSLRLAIPDTPRNARIAGDARDPHTAERFNAAPHRAELTASGACLLRGTVRLLRASEEGYLLEIRAGGAGWARHAAERMFETLGVAFRASLNPETVCRSWTDDSPVKFFPVHRDEYPRQSGSADLLPAERLLSVDDYHPFLHVATLVETIFAEAGYRLCSRFFASAYFRSLYMSGAYAGRDTAAADARMGFRARRLAAASATADDIGRVTADPYAAAHTVGNIVDTALPRSVDADGEPIADLYDNGNCFATVDGAIRFTPPGEVSVGFEYYLKFTTDHRILSRTRLAGFDRLYLGPGNDMAFTLANRHADRRGEFAANRSYRAVVFEHAAAARYRLVCTHDGMPGSVWAQFAARTAAVVSPAAGTVAEPELELLRDGAWVPYTGDWALYDGHIAERGRTTVEVRVRTAPRVYGPGAPARFDGIFFAGAEPGMVLTLHKECALRPRFFAGTGYGSVVTFAEVARHRVRQSVLLEALAHLFNLRFYTEEETRRVRVEPADDFYDGPEADWSARTDFSQPVEVADIAPEVHERRIWRYLAGDGAVKRFEAAEEATRAGWAEAVEAADTGSQAHAFAADGKSGDDTAAGQTPADGDLRADGKMRVKNPTVAGGGEAAARKPGPALGEPEAEARAREVRVEGAEEELDGGDPGSGRQGAFGKAAEGPPKESMPFGAWAGRCGSYAAKEGTRTLGSPLFHPSLSSVGHYLNAPSARILQVGDRDDATDDGSGFTPRIVGYAGMRPLPAGERWGYPWNTDSYPLAAFHFAGDAATEGFSLCFEDRDGVRGLHRYYDRQLAAESAGQRITLSLRIEPHEFEALFTPGTGAPDIRSVFRIDTGRGAVRATLHRIEAYDPAKASVRCTFTRLPEEV